MAKHRGTSTQVDRPITNNFKGLEYDPNPTPPKPIKFVQYAVVMMLVLLALVLADKCNIIHVANTQGL